MEISTKRKFTEEETATWWAVLRGHEKKRSFQVDSLFQEGIDFLGITPERIPELDEINEKLKSKTGFQGVYVKGLEDGASFYPMLKERMFPIGNFVRDKSDLNYTPEPDIIHDLYGHMPFFANPDYADYCQRFGEAASRFKDDPERLRQFERFFWFTVEFGLIHTPQGRRIFGAGIASSLGECEFALSELPEVVKFDLDQIRNQEFRIDEMQKRLFILESRKALYESLPELIEKIENSI